VFNRFGPKEEITVGGVRYMIVKEDEIVGVFLDDHKMPTEHERQDAVGDIYGKENE
jgi:hypothetical protein